ncbi:hypothetical protein DPMN_005260 [Dreissena polymorpha]|uniref:Uncharacterized protein n=1 Tax=Dreissena polymorpha TaxID=45954 RepID=A0A9D4MSC4_DREPO|nr:hypothetical protein DPMN_005260 [Dreissena polymorpha]
MGALLSYFQNETAGQLRTYRHYLVTCSLYRTGLVYGTTNSSTTRIQLILFGCPLMLAPGANCPPSLRLYPLHNTAPEHT